MRTSFKLYVFLTLGFLAACSNQQLYEAVQANRIQDCEKYVHEGAREECRKNFQTSYEDYEAGRTTDIEN